MHRSSPAGADRTLSRRSHAAGLLCLIAAMALPLFVLLALLSGGDIATLLSTRMGLALSHAPSLLMLALTVGVALSPALCASGALLAAHRFLTRFANGHWFDKAVARAIRTMGFWGIAGAICGLLAPTLIGLILTAGAGAGGKSLVISIGSTPLLALIFGSVLCLIGDVSHRAATMADDHAKIV